MLDSNNEYNCFVLLVTKTVFGLMPIYQWLLRFQPFLLCIDTEGKDLWCDIIVSMRRNN